MNDKELRLIQGPLNTPHVLRGNTQHGSASALEFSCVWADGKDLAAMCLVRIEGCVLVHPWCPLPQIHEGGSPACVWAIHHHRLWHKAQMAGTHRRKSCCLGEMFLPIGVPAVARVWAGKSHLPETMLLISLFVPTAVTLYGFFKKKKKSFYCFIQRMSRPHSCTNQYSARHEI